MIGSRPTRLAQDDEDSFAQVVRHRRRRQHVRAGQAALIGGLVWLATHDAAIFVWLVVTLACGLAETAAGARIGRLGRPLVATTQAVSAISFAGVAFILLSEPGALRLGEAILMLCALTLGNAVQAAGSRLARATLLGPPGALLVAVPVWAGFMDPGVPLLDSLLIAVAAAAFTAFSVLVSRAMHAEREALRRAGREAESGNQRWRMIFSGSPMIRVCFNATPLYERLQAAAADGRRLGDAARAEFQTTEQLLRCVRLIEANQVALDQIGERIGKPHFAPGFLDAFCEALNGIDDEGAVPPFETGLILADGEVMWVQAHYRMTAGCGAPWSLCLATYADMTAARRTAEAQEAARREAEDANRAKSEFLAVMSHEIRTPLNGVLGMAQAMEMGSLSPEQRERLGVIRQSGSALMNLMDDLLDLSRLEAGRIALDVADFDLAAVMESACAAYAAKAEMRSLAYRLDIDPATRGLWRGDAARVRQVVAILVSNAVKFTHEGGVEVRVSPSASGVRIEVADTGIGIAPDRIEGLFDKFVQADPSATRAYGGTGLGLAICQELCRAMGGAISVESEPGRGSTFAMELPLRQVEGCAPDLDAGALSGAFGLRVLAAEDNPVNRMVLQALLAQAGIEPTVVENGAEAVSAWESAHWDLILMDVRMPVMDGPTAAMTIRAREALSDRPRTPIVAVTANTMAHQVASYRAAGMDAVVGKPLNVTDLFAAMIAAVAGEGEAGEGPRAVAGRA